MSTESLEIFDQSHHALHLLSKDISFWERMKMTLAAGGGQFFDAYVSVGFALAIPLIAIDYHIPIRELAGTVGTIFLFGYTLGTILFGYLADRLGRRAVLGIAVILYSISTFLLGIVSSLFLIGLLRLIIGLGASGEVSVGNPFAMEAWNKKSQQSYSIVYTYMLWFFGYLFTIILFELFIRGGRWQDLFFVSVVPASLIILMRIFTKESPKFEAIMKFKRQSKYERKYEFFKAFKTVGFKTRFVAGIFVAIALTYSYYSLAFFYIPYVIKTYHILPKYGALAGLILVFGGIVGTVPCPWIINKFGRRVPGILVGIIEVLLGVLLWGAAMSFDSFIFVFFLWSIFSGFCWGCGLVFLNELFPTEIRGTGFGWTLGIGRVFSIIAPIGTGFLAYKMHLGVSHALMVSQLCWILYALGIYLVAETKEFDAGDIVETAS
jgi:putative MFS transporter